MESKATDGHPSTSSSATAAVSREQIREIYRKVVARDPQPKSRQKGRSYLQPQVMSFLSTVEHSQKFCPQIREILDRSIREIADWDPEDAAEAFFAVEKYGLNAMDFPWKNEFKVVKVKSKVKYFNILHKIFFSYCSYYVFIYMIIVSSSIIILQLLISSTILISNHGEYSVHETLKLILLWSWIGLRNNVRTDEAIIRSRFSTHFHVFPLIFSWIFKTAPNVI